MENLIKEDGEQLLANAGVWTQRLLFGIGSAPALSGEELLKVEEIQGSAVPTEAAGFGIVLCGLCLLLSGTLLAFAVIERCALLLQNQQLPGIASTNSAAIAAASAAVNSRGNPFEVFVHHARMMEAIVRELLFNFSRKTILWAKWLLVLFLSNDKRGLESFVKRSRLKTSSASVVKRKRLIIVRHGESVWNLVFNRGFLTFSFLPRLALMCLCELLLLWEADSVLLDSPLSTRGIEQAVAIRPVISKIKAATGSACRGSNVAADDSQGTGAPRKNAVQESAKTQGRISTEDSVSAEVPQTVTAVTVGGGGTSEEDQRRASQRQPSAGDGASDAASCAPPPHSAPSILFLTSNLRRAASTLLLCAGPRLETEDCTAKVCSSLQETTRNPDGFPLTPARKAPLPSRLEAALLGCGGLKLRARLAVEGNTGPQGVGSPPLWKRLHQLACEICAAPEGIVVAVGHSLWVKTFFRAFSDPQQSHVACVKKLSNCGVLSLELCLLQDPKTGEEDFFIDSESVHLLHGHFV